MNLVVVGLMVLVTALSLARRAGAEAVCSEDHEAFDGAAVVDLSGDNRPNNELTGDPLGDDDYTYQFTSNGVTFLFESLSEAPLDWDNRGILSLGFTGGAPALMVTISPPVAAVGFIAEGVDGCPGATFIGGDSNQVVDCAGCAGFMGAAGIGDIGSVNVTLDHQMFLLSDLVFWTDGIVVPEEADLYLDMHVNDSDASIAGNGAALHYDVSLFNLGDDAASEVVASDFLPAGTLDDSATSGAGELSFDEDLGLLRLDEPLLAVSSGGPSAIIDVDFTTPTDRFDFSCNYTLLNVATIHSASHDPNLLNNTISVPVRFDESTVREDNEICGDAIDNNCDGRADCTDPVCNCRPTLPMTSGGDPLCMGGLSSALLEMGLSPDTCRSASNPAPAHGCTVPRGACGGVTVPAFCCDPNTWSDPEMNLTMGDSCDVGVPGCVPRDPNYKEAIPGVNLHGYGYTTAGETIRYIIHYENVGDADAHDVVVLDPLDLDLDDSTLVIEDGGVYDEDTRTILWLDPVVPPHEPRSVSFEIDVRDDAVPGTRVRNVGTIIFPDAVPPTRIDTNFVEHAVPSPSFERVPDLTVLGCTETAPGSGLWTVDVVNDGPGFAFHVTATIDDPPDAVEVTDATVELFTHPDDLDELPTVIAFATTTSADTVAFTTDTPGDPCAALHWTITWEDIGGDESEVDAQALTDADEDAVADIGDNCVAVENADQLDGDGDGVGDSCDLCADTPESDTSDTSGCGPSQRDSDGDGVADADDDCPGTADDAEVDEHGCAVEQVDSDGDGVPDIADDCPGSTEGEVNEDGCSDAQLDSDGDGVSDADDDCPDTPANTDVDDAGCAEEEEPDSDDDRVPDVDDDCPDTEPISVVDEHGCSDAQRDSDADGVANGVDECPNTLPEASVDEVGCPTDTPPFSDDDGDGVPNDFDECPGTLEGTAVNDRGCPFEEPPADEDGDGVPNSIDECPATPLGSTVDEYGCALTPEPGDDDVDGVIDRLDQCQDTPPGVEVDGIGCPLPSNQENGESGCACTSTGGDSTPAFWAPALALALLLRKRRGGTGARRPL